MPFVAGALGTAAFWGMTWGTVIKGIILIAAAAYSISNRPSGGKPRNTAAALDRGQLQNSTVVSAPLPLIYGRSRVGLNRVYLGVSGGDNDYLHMVGNIGEGELEGIVQSAGVDQIWLEDKLYTDFTGLVYYEFFNGASDQAACATLNGVIPEWNDPKRYTSYIYIRFRYDSDKFQSLPNVTIEMDGLKLYNPDTAVTEFSRNGALCALDFMTRSSRRGGMGIDIGRIDLPSVIDAATYCDTKGWTCDLVLNDNQPAIDNFLQILATFRGVLIYSDGKFKLKYRDLNYESNVMTITEADVAEQGSSTLKIVQPSIFATPNAVNCKFVNSDKKYQQDDYVLVDSDAVEADGDYREEQIDLWGVTTLANVQKLANYHLERLRLNKNASFVMGSRGMALEPFDLVTLTHSRPGWAAKQFRVSMAAITDDGSVGVALEEEYASMYDDTYNLIDHDWHDTTLPNPGDAVPSVINVASSEELYDYRGRTFTRWKVDFDAPAAADYPFWDHALIWIKIGAGGDWKFMTKSEGDYYLDPVEEGVQYYCKIVSVSVFGTRQAFDDGYTISHVIQGKTALPADITGMTAIAAGDSVTIFADELAESDIAGYEVRMGEAWEGGLFIAFNETPNIRLVGVRPGTHIFWMKAKDNAGNYSDLPDSATVEVFYPANYVDVATWAWDFDGIGAHSNTEHETYDGGDALKCSHLPVNTEITCNLSLVNGAAFITGSSVDVTPYVGRKIAITAGGNDLIGYAKAAGGGETESAEINSGTLTAGALYKVTAEGEAGVFPTDKAGQSVTLTYAGSGSSGITIADDDDIDFGPGDFTLRWKGSLPDWTPAATTILLGKSNGSNTGFLMMVNTSTGHIRLRLAGNAYNSSVVAGLADGAEAEIVAVIDADAATFQPYVNGLALGTPVSVTIADISTALSLGILGNATLGTRYAGTTQAATLYNRALSAAEILDLYTNGVAAADQSGSQVELMPNQVDRDFSGASAWVQNDMNAYDETGDLSITANAVGQLVYLDAANAPTTAGKRYRLSFDVANIVGTWDVYDRSYTLKYGTVSANGRINLEFTAIGTGGIILQGMSDTASGDFDNFSLVRLGATLDLEPEGIRLDQWYDSSTNNLDAAYPAAGCTPDVDIYFTAAGTEACDASNKVKQILTPDVNGITVVSTPDGSTYNWTSDDGIDPNSASFIINFDDVTTEIGRLTGTWLSPEYDLGSVITARIWGDFIAEFVASTGSWDAIFPGAATWDDVAPAPTKWYELLAPEYAGRLSAKLYWGDTSGNLANSAEKLELLGIEISARYVQVEITIIDPDADSNLHLKTLNMTAAYW